MDYIGECNLVLVNTGFDDDMFADSLFLAKNEDSLGYSSVSGDTNASASTHDTFDSMYYLGEEPAVIEPEPIMVIEQVDHTDVLYCREELEEDDEPEPNEMQLVRVEPRKSGRPPKTALVATIHPPKGRGRAKPSRPPVWRANVVKTRGPVFFTAPLLPKQPKYLAFPQNMPLHAQLIDAHRRIQRQREIIIRSYAVHKGWTDSLVSLKEAHRYGSPREIREIEKGISTTHKEYALTHDVMYGFADIRHQLEQEAGLDSKDMLIADNTIYTIMRAFDMKLQRRMEYLLQKYASDYDLRIRAAITAIKGADADVKRRIEFESEDIQNYIHREMKMPLRLIAEVRRDTIEEVIEDGIASILGPLGPLVLALSWQQSPLPAFIELACIHEGRDLTPAELDDLYAEVDVWLQLLQTHRTAYEEHKKRAGMGRKQRSIKRIKMEAEEEGVDEEKEEGEEEEGVILVE